MITTGTSHSSEVQDLINAGWRIFSSGPRTDYIEPRTGLPFLQFEAIQLLKRHTECVTKPLAVECGTEAHARAFTRFKAPDQRVEATLKCGGGKIKVNNVSVWFPPAKEVEQFLSEEGHRNKSKQ